MYMHLLNATFNFDQNRMDLKFNCINTLQEKRLINIDFEFEKSDFLK